MPTQELQLGVHHLRIHRRKKMVRAIKAKNDDMKKTMIKYPIYFNLIFDWIFLNFASKVLA